MTTTKDVELAPDCTIKIASLTFEQVEQLLETAVPEDQKGSRDRAWIEVMMAVNNVVGQETLTRKDITVRLSEAFSALDAVMKLNDIRREALLLSGYKLEDKKPGEVLAAAATA